MRNISKDTTPSPGQSGQETAGGRCSITSIHLGLVALNVLIFTLAIAIGLRVHVLLSNQKLDACQNDRAIEQQRADQLNRTLVRNIERSNMLCNTVRNLSESLCPRGWKVQKQKCYKFSKDNRNWNTAKQQCESQKSHFVIINTLEEQNFITKYVKDKIEAYWIGLTDGAEEGKWKWVDGSTVR
ncbi:C-type lectin domain family 4 member A-like [Scyliorhinus canicula]|uniref:C-type lectin domain family 4 member A-like n=1 Tax=Scyliorhinus canicula TaxID=7830 RepID=UPI0018F5121C|nr:C-type lectin domain family 4 member A-like [Scyliorhinus canicula]